MRDYSNSKFNDLDDELDDEVLIVSKSELKRDAEVLKKLGEQLIALNATQLAQMELPENLLTAINIAKNIKKEGLRRQKQYIGKLLRQLDDVEHINQALDKINSVDLQQTMLHKKLETYRLRLITEGDTFLFELKEKYPALESQQLRNLIRLLQKEQNTPRATKAFREVFQALKNVIK